MLSDKYVYAIKNIVSGRIYIGSSQCPKHRIKKHMSALKHNRHGVELMQRDYNEYGENSFASAIVGRFEYNAGLHQEALIMQFLRTQDDRYGYNYKDHTGTSDHAVSCAWRSQPKIRGMYQPKYITSNDSQ
jgi:hypothetical protein